MWKILKKIETFTAPSALNCNHIENSQARERTREKN